MADDVASLTIKVDSKDVKTATRNVKNLGTSTTGLTRSLKGLIPILTGVLSVHLMKNLAKEAAEFGKAIGEVSTLLDDMTEMPRITQEAKNLAREFGGSPTAQAKAFYSVISAGAGSAAEATSIMTAANKLAIGGVTDIGTAVDGLTTLLNSYGLEGSEATAVSDSMFIAMRAGKTTIAELSASVGKVSALAATAGIDFNELLGSLSALTTGGIKTKESVTGLKAILSNILKPTQEATEIAAALGIEFNLAGLQARGFQGFMEHLEEQTGGNKAAIIAMFGSVEALNSILALAGPAGEKFTEIMIDMGDAAGQTETAYDKMASTIDFQTGQLKGKFADTRIEIGEFFNELAGPLISDINKNYDQYVRNVVNVGTATKDAGGVMSLVWSQVSVDTNRFLNLLGKNFAITFDNIGLGALSAGEILSLGLATPLQNIATIARIAGIEAADSIARMAVRIKKSGTEQEEHLALLDQARIASLDDVLKQHEFNTDALFALISAQKDQRIELLTGIPVIEEVSDVMGELTDATFDAWQMKMNLKDGIISIRDPIVGVTDDILNLALNTDVLHASMITADTSIGGIGTRSEEVAGILAGLGTTGTTTARDLAREFRDTRDSFADFFTDLITNGDNAFDSLAKSFKVMLTRMVAQAIASKLLSFLGFDSGTGVVSSIVRGVTGGAGGAVASSIGGAVATGLGIGGVATTVGGVVGGAGTGIAAAEAAVAGSAAGGGGIIGGATALLSKIPGWGWALGGALLAAKLFSTKSTPSWNAGFLMDPAGADPSQLGSPGVMASGLQYWPFNRRAEQSQVTDVNNSFITTDSILTDLARSAGLIVQLDRGDFKGLDERGMNVPGRFGGNFMGSAGEEGKPGMGVDAQMNRFVANWLTGLWRDNPQLPQEGLQKILTLGNAEDMINRAGAAVSGSHKSGLNRVPFDGYRAELHTGERVQTKSQAESSDMTASVLQEVLKVLQVAAVGSHEQREEMIGALQDGLRSRERGVSNALI